MLFIYPPQADLVQQRMHQTARWVKMRSAPLVMRERWADETTKPEAG